jgi:hypothetical protein
MKAVVLVPYRSDKGPRARNWRHACKQWNMMGLPVYTADAGSREFQRAAARNEAARAAGAWDVALFADADILLSSIEQAEAAIMRTYLTGAYTVAYSELHYLTELGTQEAIHGHHPLVCESNEIVTLTWECCFAVRRDIWDFVGGFDERFLGWGGQGIAFFYAYATFGGRERISGQAFHMAHPLVDRTKDPHFPANGKLCERYRAAVDNREAMLKILEER